MAPTLLASRSSLPLAPGDGAELRLGRPGASFMAPTLFTSCNALPPEGAVLAWGGPARRTLVPKLFTSCIALPPEWATKTK